MSTAATHCPCGTNNAYEKCCAPFIKGAAFAPTAEALMRSRYTAYVKQAIDYVAATHDPAKPDDFDRAAAQQWSENTDWMGLEIKATEDGQSADETGMVEFVARFKTNGQELSHHEVSTFRKDDGKWYYVEGKTMQTPVMRSGPKLGRNDPCHCGSGKKLKKCHGAA